jgi:hypothetical protein
MRILTTMAIILAVGAFTAPGETPKEVIARARKIVAKEFGEDPGPCVCNSQQLMNGGCACGGN